MLGCDHSSVVMAEGFVMLANAVLMFTSAPILHHPSFMKNESRGGGEVVRQHRGAINLAVNVQKYASSSLPHFAAATHFHMQKGQISWQ